MVINPNFTAKSEYERQRRVLYIGFDDVLILQTIIRGIVSREFAEN